MVRRSWRVTPMKKQGIVTLSVTIILLAVLLYLALFGVSFGLREIRPMATLIKEQKLGLDLTGGFMPYTRQSILPSRILKPRWTGRYWYTATAWMPRA